jgi:tight adherence protein C
MGALAAERFAEVRFGLGQRVGKELRLKLVRAGYFSPQAIRVYVLARVCAVIAFPLLVLLSFALLAPNLSTLQFVLLAAASLGVGVLGPDAYLSHRQSRQIAEYRLNFPDLLDLLTVCVTAGLTVEASFERIRDRLSKQNRALGHNIELMGAEMRAGRSSVDALAAFADRLGLDEAASFVAVLQHSVELGGDVAVTLREFSEDMRSKRMLLAEKTAKRAAGQNGGAAGPWYFSCHPDDRSPPCYTEIAPTYRLLKPTRQRRGTIRSTPLLGSFVRAAEPGRLANVRIGVDASPECRE